MMKKHECRYLCNFVSISLHENQMDQKYEKTKTLKKYWEKVFQQIK